MVLKDNNSLERVIRNTQIEASDPPRYKKTKADQASEQEERK